jgi:hypothetical protein
LVTWTSQRFSTLPTKSRSIIKETLPQRKTKTKNKSYKTVQVASCTPQAIHM